MPDMTSSLRSRLCVATALCGAALLLGCSGEVSTTDTGSADAALTAGPLQLSVALKLGATTVESGQTLNGSVTYRNPHNHSVTVRRIVIAGRPPGGTNLNGPYDDFSPEPTQVTFAPGQSITVTASRPFTASDPTGSWYAYSTYQDANGVWHDSSSHPFTVDAVGSLDAGPGPADAGSPGPVDAGTSPGADAGVPPSPADAGVSACGNVSSFYPPAGGMTPVGATLPTDAQAECMIVAHPGEQRPDNAAYRVAPTATQLTTFVPDFVTESGGDSHAAAFAQRVTGAFTAGTTDELIQWAAYKWGIDPDVLRAVGINETYWHHSLYVNGYPVEDDGFGDFTTTTSACASDFPLSRGYLVRSGSGYAGPYYDQCPQSFGFVQWKRTAWPGTYPQSRESLPFNLDAWGARIRLWYEGYSYCGTSAKGDLWEAVAAHNTGQCLAAGGGISYVNNAKTYMSTKPWNQSGF
jgi:hypothetical protein